MKISQLIAELEDIRRDNGDIEVYISNVNMGVSGKIDSVETLGSVENGEGVVSINAKYLDIDTVDLD